MDKDKKEERLGHVLDTLVCDRNWQYRLGLNRVFLFWEETVGKETAKIARPEVVKGEVLWVCVPDSMRMQQLHLEKISLLASINRRLEEEAKKFSGSSKLPVLADIRFKIGMIDPFELPQAVSDVNADLQVVEPQRERDFDMLARSIKDSELRDRIKRLWLSQEKRFIDSGSR